MSFEWIVRPEDAWGALLDAVVDKVEAEILAYVDSLTDEIAAWMKANARWTDRTGDARANLYSDVFYSVRESITILLAHGPTIDYSYWLEMHPFYGILGEAVDHFAPLFYRKTREILQKVSAGQ